MQEEKDMTKLQPTLIEENFGTRAVSQLERMTRQMQQRKVLKTMSCFHIERHWCLFTEIGLCDNCPTKMKWLEMKLGYGCPCQFSDEGSYTCMLDLVRWSFKQKLNISSFQVKFEKF